MANKFHTTGGILKIFAKYQPSFFGYAIPKLCIMSLLPIITVWLPKLVIERLTGYYLYRDVLLVVFTYITILIVVKTIESILSYKEECCVNRLKNTLQLNIGDSAMHTGLSEIESSEYKEKIAMAQNISEIAGITALLQELISCAITIATLSFVIIKLNIIFVLLVALNVGVKVLCTFLKFRNIYRSRMKQAENDKIGGYLDYLQYYNKSAEKEIRVNALEKWFFRKIKHFRERMVEIQLKIFTQSHLFEMLQKVLVAVQTFLVLLMLSEYYLEGSVSIADFTMYFTATTTLAATLSRITEQVMQYNQQIVNCRDYSKLVKDTIRENHLEAHETEAAVSQVQLISFQNVSFTYPHTDKQTLKNITFEIQKGEKVLLVGKNGEGKSTIVKLLCKFYKPDAGQILINDINIWEIPNEEYYKLLAAVFQDFSMFAFSVKENILLSKEDENVRSCMDASGVGNTVRSLKNKENTHISRILEDDGVEFSGGEEQKLAIARALYKNAPLLILDEPTANLDVVTECDIYNKFCALTEGKTAAIISHRLSASTICDKIVVIDKGIVGEMGSHAELMKKGGIYAQMYKKQSESYLEFPRK